MKAYTRIERLFFVFLIGSAAMFFSIPVLQEMIGLPGGKTTALILMLAIMATQVLVALYLWLAERRQPQ